MIEHITIGIVLVLLLGSGAQWLAWRFDIPSILLLLIFGFVAGPVVGILPPAALQGEWVYAFVSLSIGVILFEGGLSLQLSELREVGKAVRNLITVGVLVTWVLSALAAYFIIDFDLQLAILVGAILSVTGPTVIIPLLRQVRPRGRVGTIARWEGITIDPVGAILAVLVLEVIILLHGSVSTAGDFTEAALHTLGGLLLTAAVGVSVSLAGAVLLTLLLRHRLVPDYLQGTVALVIVVATFALSNVLREESGLLAATLLGIMMANQKYVPVRRISEFKENLQVLLIGSLFIILSARLDLGVLQYIELDTLLFLAVLIFVVRPLAVLASAYRTDLVWQEKVFLSWMAPRGIVAAAVASLFAFELEDIFMEGAAALVPTVFMVIVGTVAVYGLTISPLARRLGLAEPDAQGLLFVGGHPWALQMAKAVQDLGFKVLVVDTNARNVEQAHKRGLTAERVNVLAESVLDELDLGGLGRLISMTPNDEVNSLAALHFAEVFDSADVYQLPMRTAGKEQHSSDVPLHLRGHILFSEQATYQQLTQRFTEGDDVAAVEITEQVPFDRLQERFGDEMILLFVARGNQLLVHSPESPRTPGPGDVVVILAPPVADGAPSRSETPFERLVTGAEVIDLEAAAPFRRIVAEVAQLLARELPVSGEALTEAFIESWQSSMMLVVNGVALPHCRIPGIGEPRMALVRYRAGLDLTGQEEGEAPHKRIYALFFLVSDEANPGRHLRILANISNRLDDSSFLGKWRAADNEQELKEAMLREDRYRALQVGVDEPAHAFAGQPVGTLPLPEETQVALVARGTHIFRPTEETVLQAGDRLTVIGSPGGIQRLYNSQTQEA